MQAKDFPPQAYTKETVSEAFTWLQSQPDEVKKQATQTHQLIALYLKDKSQQYWTSKTKTPVEDFKSQLQDMAQNHADSKTKKTPHQNTTSTLTTSNNELPQTMDEPAPHNDHHHQNGSFTLSNDSPVESSHSHFISNESSHQLDKDPSHPIAKKQASDNIKETCPINGQYPSQGPSTTPHSRPLSSSANDSKRHNFVTQSSLSKSELCVFKEALDATSLTALEQVKSQLNLSSFLEANRLLIALGFEQIKSLLPDGSDVFKEAKNE